MAQTWAAAPGLAGLTLALILAAVPLTLALLLDPRTQGGEPIWLKPLKFHLALAVFFGTLVVFARWLPPGTVATRRWRVFETLVIGATLAELLWIGGAAALGTRSHFNVTTPVWAVLYPVMGLLAVTLTSTSLVMGLAIARNRDSGLSPAVHLSVWLGLVLTFVLTVVAAFVMSSGPGHHVGVPVTGARVPLLGWSREVGDLRVAHFLATHTLHVLPLAGLVLAHLPVRAGRLGVVLAALAWTGLVAAALLQALAGRPVV